MYSAFLCLIFDTACCSPGDGRESSGNVLQAAAGALTNHMGRRRREVAASNLIGLAAG
jgi:hypothetical protein